MNYVTGELIKSLREKKKITQKELADLICVSDKTVSKWETGKGLPDIGILPDLAASLGVSVAELLVGEINENQNRSSNMKKVSFYVCPVCGNIIQSVGQGTFSCCGVTLPPLEVEEPDEADEQHKLNVEIIDGEYYISLNHDMNKQHYISFIAYVTSDRVELKKLYPEQAAEGSFRRRGHGIIYVYCNRHGLFRCLV